MKVPHGLRHILEGLRELLFSAAALAVLALVLLALAYWWLDPNPPKYVMLATGPERSAYDEFGKRYRKALAPYGIEVMLVPTQGSTANLELLRDGKVDLAFVQGGSDTMGSKEDSGLVSLGSLFVEPLWLFYREDKYRDEVAKKVEHRDLSALTQVEGLSLNVGTEGSGVPVLMDKLFEANRIEPARLKLSRLEETPAATAFLNGELDALVFASAPESPMVQMLLATPGVKLMDFSQSEAYSRRFPFLSPVVLPRGVVDLAQDQPPQDVRLVATTTSLLAREGTHPALLQLFAQAARQEHGSAGWFNEADRFPTTAHSEYPVSSEADRTYRNGRPFLERWLPFWGANLVERMWLALGIIIAVLLPLSRIVPPLYQFRIRSRVFRWYGQLRDLEQRLQRQPGEAKDVVKSLDALDDRVARIRVPLSYAEELYALRNNIAKVRRKALEAPAG